MLAQTIELALAPVFVLVAIGNIMNMLSMRLGRVVDRARALGSRHAATDGAEHDTLVREIRSCDRRIALIGQAIRLLVLSGVAIALTVLALFVEELFPIELGAVIAVTFLAAIALLMIALLLFLREVREASAALRIPRELLELDRQL